MFFSEPGERVFGDRVGTVTGSGGGIGERQAMAQQTQQWRSGNGEMAWLSALIGIMDKASRPELGATPCAPSLLAVPHGLYGSNFSLRN